MTMQISGEVIVGFIVSAVIGLIAFLAKRQFVDRMDTFEAKLDKLIETVHEMSKLNSRDHTEVVERIANIEGKLGID